ncbi:hypothetical protein MKW98_007121 [Papaver atlanticum]|uniref:3'-5' exonuclease domain-containing protein n=1 Tax=Papaver atlanticum TaxID=357466 RepID=A0AAD4XHF6_9MAGN|nr:hypothetical protein MKW98_007121 [Papaver atlanticum]
MSSTSNAEGNTNGGKHRRYPKKHTSIEVVDKKAETHHKSIVEQWIDVVYKSFADKLGNLVVGLDIKRVRNNEEVDVLQLCVGHRCLIFQFFARNKDQVPKSLVDFLNDHKIKFVGAGIDRVADKLLVDYGLRISTTEDLGNLADRKLGTRGLYQAELNSLVNIVLGQHLHHQPQFRRITFSRWGRDYLKNEQVEYACLDAYASFKLGLYLLPLPAPKETKQSQGN